MRVPTSEKLIAKYWRSPLATGTILESKKEGSTSILFTGGSDVGRKVVSRSDLSMLNTTESTGGWMNPIERSSFR